MFAKKLILGVFLIVFSHAYINAGYVDNNSEAELLTLRLLADALPDEVSTLCDIPWGDIDQEYLEYIIDSYSPDEYFFNKGGLNWADHYDIVPADFDEGLDGECYHPYGFSIRDWHYIYWFSYRPPSYNAYLAWVPIRADPYGYNGVLVQKRDMLWCCGFNPYCGLIWLWICAK